ncbi:RBBP9/YdeN family alpha/beta hydrolase [uncultured Jatrophihabitans sp.]|uniref:RBBP9/YdeN family alpha/beta hydrolase n=1 Tax=uncultured Jatrophihabitans sp. TaxID=1610747 RepID=UPI0035C9D844
MPPRRPSRSVPTVVIPGWQGSGQGHWQTWLEGELRAQERQTLRPAFADLDNPDLDDWLTALRASLADLPADGYDVVAHSLGSVLWLHHVAGPGTSPRAARVLLVAPPSPHTTIPEVAEFFPPPLDIDTVRRGADGTVLVAGDDDEYLPEGIAAAYGLPLKMATTVVPGGGHLNPDAGYGEWPAVLDWCRRDNLAFY